MLLPSLREVMDRHGLAPQKHLGQNFLLDPILLSRIVRVAGDLTQSVVLEIGPGPGGLTRAILEAGALQVFAIEQDARCIPALAELQASYPNRLHVIHGDALKVKPQDFGASLKIIANLPYHIGTALLVQWLQDLKGIESLTLLLQKEVVLRLIGQPSTKDYGRLSILTQWLCEAYRAFDIPPGAFTPAPKVVSSVVHLKPRLIPQDELMLLSAVQRITQAAFSQRRKMLRSSLKQLFSPEDMLACDISPQKRAEELTVDAFLRLARAYTS